jgi:hypothetical protein
MNNHHGVKVVLNYIINHCGEGCPYFIIAPTMRCGHYLGPQDLEPFTEGFPHNCPLWDEGDNMTFPTPTELKEKEKANEAQIRASVMQELESIAPKLTSSGYEGACDPILHENKLITEQLLIRCGWEIDFKTPTYINIFPSVERIR